MISHGSVAESASTRAVCARSAAEMPVLTPSRASTEIVYAVRSLSWLCGVISGISSRSSMSAGIGTQITPLLCRIVNAISSGVALLAAKMMSPSFSRVSSSTTTTALPAAMSAIARSMLSSRTPSCWASCAAHAGTFSRGSRGCWPGAAAVARHQVMKPATQRPP